MHWVPRENALLGLSLSPPLSQILDSDTGSKASPIGLRMSQLSFLFLYPRRESQTLKFNTSLGLLSITLDILDSVKSLLPNPVVPSL